MSRGGDMEVQLRSFRISVRYLTLGVTAALSIGCSWTPEGPSPAAQDAQESALRASGAVQSAAGPQQTAQKGSAVPAGGDR
jgi:hypothetical protein